MKTTITLSVVIPVFNEAAGLLRFHNSLKATVQSVVGDNYELIYCNDGSEDKTADILHDISKENPNYQVISLSKNFGKEFAVVAGLYTASGQAVILMDGDGQHPVSAIPKFYDAWQSGAQVVVGRRTKQDREGFGKRIVSKLFYATYNFITGNRLDALSTDYRLLDREVVDAYRQLPETNRLNRFLIDWVGFKRQYIPVNREERIAGETSFTFRSLSKLALDTLVSSSVRPLYVLLVIGMIIMGGALLLGLVVGIEQILFGDPLGWKFTGTALLSILILFLVGLLLISQGITSLYIAATYRQVKQRPLYIINKRLSYNLRHNQDA